MKAGYLASPSSLIRNANTPIFLPFTTNTLFGIIKRIRLVSLMITEIKSSDDAAELKLVHASNAMYSDAFVRYDPKYFRVIFYQLITTISFR